MSLFDEDTTKRSLDRSPSSDCPGGFSPKLKGSPERMTYCGSDETSFEREITESLRVVSTVPRTSWRPSTSPWSAPKDLSTVFAELTKLYKAVDTEYTILVVAPTALNIETGSMTPKLNFQTQCSELSSLAHDNFGLPGHGGGSRTRGGRGNSSWHT